jgi:hypothetical protein
MTSLIMAGSIQQLRYWKRYADDEEWSDGIPMLDPI